MNRSLLIKLTVLAGFLSLAAIFAVYSLRSTYIGVRAGKADENYLKSTDCRECHEGHFDSWRRTHHSRMTQEISAESVQGDFVVENEIEYQGVRAKMEKRGDAFYMSFAAADGGRETHQIERTIGSRRIEQYLTKRDGQYYRLPIAYDLVNGRWISLNGSFFYPDGGNFDQHVAQWDTNCVFCHNVKAQPNFNFSTNKANTEVTELGIACGACHGQGAEHAERAASPLKRVWARLTGANTKEIVHPLEIDTDRSMMICGHCHGQRVPEPTTRIREIMGKGDPFDAGEDLSQYYRPVHRETTLGNVSFANRFWADGSPRLTAFEYQGITNSPCFLKGEPGKRITCTTCHTMHEGDVKGQLTPEMRTNTACTQCHTELQNNTLTPHTKHGPESAGSSCYACHMPEVVYGIQAIHKTHQISVPDPSLTITKNVPNACNQCHIDKSANWAVESAKSMWPNRYRETKTSDDPQHAIAEGVRSLFAGDALTRALMADAMSKHAEDWWAAAYLVEAFADDNYPIVRYFAANGLAEMNSSVAKPDYLADADLRRRQIDLWRSLVDPARLADARRTATTLKKLRENVDLEVGE